MRWYVRMGSECVLSSLVHHIHHLMRVPCKAGLHKLQFSYNRFHVRKTVLHARGK